MTVHVYFSSTFISDSLMMDNVCFVCLVNLDHGIPYKSKGRRLNTEDGEVVSPGQPLTRYTGRGSGQTCMLHSCLTCHSFCGVLTTG